LGTEFVITDYAGDPGSEVVVASGTLAVRSTMADTTQSATVLRRGELARFDSGGLARVDRDIDLTHQLAWIQGRLVFNDTPVADVVTQLNRWYGGAVGLAGPRLTHQRFTATYFSQSLATALGEVATAIGAQVVHRGDSLILVPRAARSREK
jgi:transmembrane sensor